MTTEKEFLAAVFAIEKFRSYIVGSKVTIISHGEEPQAVVDQMDSIPPGVLLGDYKPYE